METRVVAGAGGTLSARLGWLLARPEAPIPLLIWSPVFLSVGIGAYFSIRQEPSVLFLLAAGQIAAAFALAARHRGPWAAAQLAVAMMLGGFALAGARAHLVAQTVLPFRYYGPVEGRVIDIDRSYSDQIRVTLDQVVLKDTVAARTPAYVRIALHEDAPGFDPEPGMHLRVMAHLSPPDGPVEPGGFDFQRLAWFSGLGGVGYSRNPAEVLATGDGGLSLVAFRMRMALSRAMQARIGGQAGAFAAALMTGDRSGVSQATNDALRASNLSHIISISGLHTGLLSGFVFALCRYGLALCPPVALRLNTKKVAAGIALVAATFYMVLAGPDVATRRSYIMAAVMLLAVLLDRRAISLRSVALSALICLILEPESLVEPGFQMSFGATLALIVGFEHWSALERRLPRLLRPVAMAVLSSAIAGSATAPIAAAHFNRLTEYGLIANLLAVPIMGILVMPAGVLAAILAPFGLAAPALWVLGQGAGMILILAARVAALDGAVLPVVAPPAMVLPLLGLGGVLLLVARMPALRGVGLAVLAGALLLWAGADRPALLIASDGSLAGLMTADGRALSKPKGGGFISENWLQDDGDAADQATAFARPGFSGPKGARRAAVGGHTLGVFTAKAAQSEASPACVSGAIVVMTGDWQGGKPACRLFDRKRLRKTGAIAGYVEPDGLVLLTARDVSGNRLWNSWWLREAPSARRPVRPEG